MEGDLIRRMTFPEVDEASGWWSAVSDKRSGVWLDSLEIGSLSGMEICMRGGLCRIGDVAMAAVVMGGEVGDVRGRSRNSSCS